MISKNTYEKLKRQCGLFSSWAIWADSGKTPGSNTSWELVGNANSEDKLIDKLSVKYILVAENASRPTSQCWEAFHCTGRQNDYKLRFALQDTCLWGCYITDIIKGHVDSYGQKVYDYFLIHPKELHEKTRLFQFELKTINDELCGEKPVILAMGKNTFKLLNLLKSQIDMPEIIQVTHYAYRINKECYRDRLKFEMKNRGYIIDIK